MNKESSLPIVPISWLTFRDLVMLNEAKWIVFAAEKENEQRNDR